MLISKLSGWFFDFFTVNLLLVRSQQAEIIIIKRLIQRNNATRVRVEPRSRYCDHRRRINVALILSTTSPTVSTIMILIFISKNEYKTLNFWMVLTFSIGRKRDFVDLGPNCLIWVHLSSARLDDTCCIISLFIWSKLKWLFWRTGFYSANQNNLKCFQKDLIGWKKAGPPKSHFLFWSCKQADKQTLPIAFSIRNI